MPVVDRFVHLVGSDGTSVGSPTVYTEDDAVPAAPVGNTWLGERYDTPATLGEANGDWVHPRMGTRGGLLTVHESSANTQGDGASNAPHVLVGHSFQVLAQRMYGFRYNSLGATDGTWDRERPNVAGTALASAARTTTQTTTLVNYSGRYLNVYLDVTNAGTGSITVSITEIDPVTSTATAILTGSAVTTVSHNIYRVGPGLTAAANAVANAVLPRNFSIVVTHNNANSITYSLGYQVTM